MEHLQMYPAQGNQIQVHARVVLNSRHLYIHVILIKQAVIKK